LELLKRQFHADNDDCMTKSNFYIITGGPGGGKTSLLDNLALKGYNYIPETARQIIKARLERGLSPRPDAKTFAQDIFNKDWTNFIANSDVSSLLFFDRSFIDSACMLFDSDVDSYYKIKDTLQSHRYNSKIFITSPWKEIFRNDTERDQSFEQSIEVYKRLDKWYREHGYDIVMLPEDTIENRVNFVLNHVSS
jgi:predicted ATPase